MNSPKCGYIIFSNNNSQRKVKFNLNFPDGPIPYNPNPIFLGFTFDERLCFNVHSNNLKLRAIKRLNIIKTLSHKSWHLTKYTLIGIYNA